MWNVEPLRRYIAKTQCARLGMQIEIGSGQDNIIPVLYSTLVASSTTIGVTASDCVAVFCTGITSPTSDMIVYTEARRSPARKLPIAKISLEKPSWKETMRAAMLDPPKNSHSEAAFWKHLFPYQRQFSCVFVDFCLKRWTSIRVLSLEGSLATIQPKSSSCYVVQYTASCCFLDARQAWSWFLQSPSKVHPKILQNTMPQAETTRMNEMLLIKWINHTQEQLAQLAPPLHNNWFILEK